MVPTHQLADARPHPMVPTHQLADARPHPTPGPLLLSGGRDHTRTSVAIDRALLACLDTATPRVLVVPAASSGRTRSAAEIRALHHWSRLGAEVHLLTVDGDTAATDPPATLGAADLIVLTGGRHTRSGMTTAMALWPHIEERWRQGAALSGSSVGATVLCGWRRQVGDGYPLRFVRSTGVVPDAAAAPHFNRPVVRRWTLAASRAQPYLTIVGLDERTAIVGHAGRYTVHGAGAVTIVRAGASRRYGTGSRLRLGVDASPTARFPYPWAPIGAASAGRITPEPPSS
jgi:cyanophycinase-like exopeptidase